MIKQFPLGMPAMVCRLPLLMLFILFYSSQVQGQQTGSWKVEKMPEDLETDFALSALPPHVRPGATVYLLDPDQGYYVARKGTNKFICFVVRTEWQWAEFRQDLATAISYDAEGAKSIFPVYQDVEAMRASGKFTAAQVKDTITARFANGIYKAPARPGLSYMLAPVMRSYDGGPDIRHIASFSLPHYMFYAPYLGEDDIGGNSPAGGAMVLGNEKGPHGYIMVPVGEKEKNNIMEEHKSLMKRLIAYKSYFEIMPPASQHKM